VTPTITIMAWLQQGRDAICVDANLIFVEIGQPLESILSISPVFLPLSRHAQCIVWKDGFSGESCLSLKESLLEFLT